MTKPVETGANDGRCTLGGDCPIATNPHYHHAPMTDAGSKAQAECWQHVHKGLAPTVLRTQAEVDKHKAMGHDVREVSR